MPSWCPLSRPMNLPTRPKARMRMTMRSPSCRPGRSRRPELFGVVPAAQIRCRALEYRRDSDGVDSAGALCSGGEGRLHVFLPYVPVVADYFDLVAAVEDTARIWALPVWLEGYAPPSDPRLQVVWAYTRSRRAGGQSSAHGELGRSRGAQRVLHEEAHENRLTAEQICLRRQPALNRRRQPHRSWIEDAGG